MSAKGLDAATGEFLRNDRSPGRQPGTVGNCRSHFYLSPHWSRKLPAEDEGAALKAEFAPSVEALIAAQGKAEDIGGPCQPGEEKASAAMRSSATFNGVLG